MLVFPLYEEPLVTTLTSGEACEGKPALQLPSVQREDQRSGLKLRFGGFPFGHRIGSLIPYDNRPGAVVRDVAALRNRRELTN